MAGIGRQTPFPRHAQRNPNPFGQTSDFTAPDPDARRARTVNVPLVKTGARGRIKKVNTYSREILDASALQASARQSEGGARQGGTVTDRLSAVPMIGETTEHDGTFWTISGLCGSCGEASALTCLPVIGHGERAEAFRPPVAVSCTCTARGATRSAMDAIIAAVLAR